MQHEPRAVIRNVALAVGPAGNASTSTQGVKMESLIPFVFGALILGLVPLCISWSLTRSQRMLDEWAAESHLKLVSASPCWINRGPFFWTTSNGQMVYRITVASESGESRTGWARCGGFWGGLFVDRVEVRWDDA